MEFFATCTSGQEAALGDELRALGIEKVRPLRSGANFRGEMSSAHRVLQWSRVAKRVLLTLARVPAKDADALYKGAVAIPWEEHLTPESTFAVNAHGNNDQLKNTHFIALKVKDAVCDRMAEACGSRPNVDTEHPDTRINVMITREHAIVSIELSSEGVERTLLTAAQSPSEGQTTITVRDKTVVVNDVASEQFAMRLNKVVKQHRKWAKNNRVSAYRVYDADLPDYNMAIDVYNGIGEDEGRTLVQVAEYAAPKEIEPAKTIRRLVDALAIVSAVFEIPPESIFVKKRVKAKGGSQYAKGAQGDKLSMGTRLITQENGLAFEVNLSDYLDTGLFLDHRDTRKLIKQLAPGKSFLNLFAYTGTASVYAAAGGAKFTTTVDMSNTYLDWARRNFELNGFTGRDYQFDRADVKRWVQEKRHTRERWDLVFVDPPTFSNSSKMGKRTWSVQDDHAELLIGVSRLLTKTGAIIFSCNLRSFKPDVEALAKAGVVINDITKRTIPEDFSRNPKVHHCYVLRRG